MQSFAKHRAPEVCTESRLCGARDCGGAGVGPPGGSATRQRARASGAQRSGGGPLFPPWKYSAPPDDFSNLIMARCTKRLPSLAATLASLGLLWLLAAPARGAEVLILSGGGRIEGQVVKRSADAVFIDVGYTILVVPSKEVKGIQASPESPTQVPRGEAAPLAERREPNRATDRPLALEGAIGKGRREGLYYAGQGEPGSIKDKAREVAEGVVQVICPGKMGSGFIINEEGYVVTNCHVVEQDQDIAVDIYVREEHDLRKIRLERVRIVALNPFLDLALLKIEEEEKADSKSSARGEPGVGVKFRKAYLGDSDLVRVGDPVFAVGSPLGLERTVTEGIVSNARRALEGLIYIQTSAPINPGNSGGPLFNDRGEVVGITSLKVLFGESLGFAIPVNYLKDFLSNRESFAFDKDHPNTGIRYLAPPGKGLSRGREL